MSLLSNAFKSLTGSSITQAVSAVAPIAGSAFGPVGMVAGNLLPSILTSGGGFGGGVASAYPGGAPIPDFGRILSGGGQPSVTQAGFPIPTGALSRLGTFLTGGAVGSAVGTAARVGMGVLRTAAGKIRGVVLASGKFVSSAKGAALAKRVGIEAASAALGIGAVELAEMVLSDSETRARRRGRGISGRDMRNARRTIRKVESLHRQIQRACSHAHVAPARRRGRTFTQASGPRELTVVRN